MEKFLCFATRHRISVDSASYPSTFPIPTLPLHFLSPDKADLQKQPRNLTTRPPPTPLLPHLAMAGRLLAAPLLLLVLLQLPAPSQVRAYPLAAAHSGRCPRPEERPPPFLQGLRRTCRTSTEGHPAKEVRVSHHSPGLFGWLDWLATDCLLFLGVPAHLLCCVDESGDSFVRFFVDLSSLVNSCSPIDSSVTQFSARSLNLDAI